MRFLKSDRLLAQHYSRSLFKNLCLIPVTVANHLYKWLAKPWSSWQRSRSVERFLLVALAVIVGRGEQLSVARPPGRVREAPQARKGKIQPG
jgi:hypothetical protein